MKLDPGVTMGLQELPGQGEQGPQPHFYVGLGNSTFSRK